MLRYERVVEVLCVAANMFKWRLAGADLCEEPTMIMEYLGIRAIMFASSQSSLVRMLITCLDHCVVSGCSTGTSAFLAAPFFLYFASAWLSLTLVAPMQETRGLWHFGFYQTLACDSSGRASPATSSAAIQTRQATQAAAPP